MRTTRRFLMRFAAPAICGFVVGGMPRLGGVSAAHAITATPTLTPTSTSTRTPTNTGQPSPTPTLTPTNTSVLNLN
jgi:hypothetical protein